MQIHLSLPQPVLFILDKLQKAGYEAYVVGGAVRDLLIENKETETNRLKTNNFDYDFTTNATPEQIMALFPESFYENTFGTVSITHQEALNQMGVTEENEIKKNQNDSNRIIDIAQATKLHESLVASAQKAESEETSTPDLPNYQITTFRSESAYEDHRRPSEVQWGETLEQDLQRRDFTINAMALKVIEAGVCQVIDPHRGLQDLERGLIRTVGNPVERFQEDALRMLRAVRFSIQLNMQIEDSTFEAIIQHAPTLRHISWERIRDEVLKILKSDFPAEGVMVLDEAGLLQFILPELIEGKNVQQGGHHTTDVWTHSLDALRECPSSDPLVRLATLLHDVAKPRTYKVINGQITFYNHEIIGARMARSIGRRLRLPSKEVDRLFTLVRYHMFHYQPHNTDAAIRRFMRKVGLHNLDDILDLREADRLGSGARRTSWRLEEMKERMIAQLHQPMDLRDLAIDGSTLIQELNLQPGPMIGKILHELFEAVLEDPELNTRKKLLEKAESLVESEKKSRN
ncbi:MAG TPA: HDIG domain-containing protein [Patescibacteria group bacterium]